MNLLLYVVFFHFCFITELAVKVYKHIQEFQKIDAPVVLTTGTFDGVHIGHQKIIKHLREVANQCNGETVLLTFDPHPRSVLQPDAEVKMLTGMDEKIALLERFGLDHLIIHPFSKEFSRTTSLEFVRDLLVNKLGVQKLVIGYDHHFGRNREGSFEHLKEFGPMYGFDVEEIQALDVDHVNVSSTKIRKALLEGDLDTARTYLSYDYSLTGTVVKGKQLGRDLGYPTANIDVVQQTKLIPKNGVYAVICEVNGLAYHGMLNLGTNPTVDNGGIKLEVHLFQFSNDIYGERLKVTFKHRIRDEQKFESIDALKQQLKSDEATAHRMFGY